MQRARRFWIVVSMVLLALVMAVIGTIQVTRVTAGSRAEEHENEAVVYRNGQACGVERWSVKTGTDAGARSINLGYHFPTAIRRLSALTAPSSLPSSSRVRPVETTVYTLTGTLLRYKEEQDSDYHLVISDGQHTMITEIPASYCVGSSSPLAAGIRRARAQFTQRYHPSPDHFLYTHAKVQITGVGFFDFLHGQSGVAPNGIELHPVLDIQFGANVKTAPPSPKPRPVPPPVPSHGTFTLRAYVSPSSMPYNAYPTLYGQTISGASCTASVVYSTGRQPRSFDGSARTAGGNGVASWNWHEETRGSGGTATVQCTYRGQRKTAQAAFSVTGSDLATDMATRRSPSSGEVCFDRWHVRWVGRGVPSHKRIPGTR